MATKEKKSKRESAEISLKPLIILAGVLGLALTIYLSYRASISDQKLFSFSLLALFTGLLFESYRITRNWKTIAVIFTGTYLFSLLNFLPSINESIYNYKNHIATWPYYIIAIFAVIFGITHKNKIKAQLAKGINALVIMSLVYWAFEYGFQNYYNWISNIILLVTIYAIVYTFSDLPISRKIRLSLGVWSTVIICVFAIDNIISVLNNPITESVYVSKGINKTIQYFLLGVSVVYITKNFVLLISFIPTKKSIYKEELRRIKNGHISRYSEQEINFSHCIFGFLFTGVVYWLNHQFQILTRHTMIWLVLLIVPILLELITLIKQKIKS